MTTEPPDQPPDDSEDPYEINDVDEFLAEINRVEDDNDLTDLIGAGYDVAHPDQDEQTLVDMLQTWRDDVNSEPIGQNEQEGQNVSIQENAGKLRAIAGRTAVMGAVQQAVQQLNEDQAEAITAADPAGASEDAQTINGAFEAAKTALNDALGVVQAAYGAAGDIAGKHGA